MPEDINQLSFDCNSSFIQEIAQALESQANSFASHHAQHYPKLSLSCTESSTSFSPWLRGWVWSMNHALGLVDISLSGFGEQFLEMEGWNEHISTYLNERVKEEESIVEGASSTSPSSSSSSSSSTPSEKLFTYNNLMLSSKETTQIYSRVFMSHMKDHISPSLLHLLHSSLLSFKKAVLTNDLFLFTQSLYFFFNNNDFLSASSYAYITSSNFQQINIQEVFSYKFRRLTYGCNKVLLSKDFQAYIQRYEELQGGKEEKEGELQTLLPHGEVPSLAFLRSPLFNTRLHFPEYLEAARAAQEENKQEEKTASSSSPSSGSHTSTASTTSLPFSPSFYTSSSSPSSLVFFSSETLIYNDKIAWTLLPYLMLYQPRSIFKTFNDLAQKKDSFISTLGDFLRFYYKSVSLQQHLLSRKLERLSKRLKKGKITFLYYNKMKYLLCSHFVYRQNLLFDQSQSSQLALPDPDRPVYRSSETLEEKEAKSYEKLLFLFNYYFDTENLKEDRRLNDFFQQLSTDFSRLGKKDNTSLETLQELFFTNQQLVAHNQPVVEKQPATYLRYEKMLKKYAKCAEDDVTFTSPFSSLFPVGGGDAASTGEPGSESGSGTLAVAGSNHEEDLDALREAKGMCKCCNKNIKEVNYCSLVEENKRKVINNSSSHLVEGLIKNLIQLPSQTLLDSLLTDPQVKGVPGVSEGSSTASAASIGASDFIADPSAYYLPSSPSTLPPQDALGYSVLREHYLASKRKRIFSYHANLVKKQLLPANLPSLSLTEDLLDLDILNYSSDTQLKLMNSLLSSSFIKSALICCSLNYFQYFFTYYLESMFHREEIYFYCFFMNHLRPKGYQIYLITEKEELPKSFYAKPEDLEASKPEDDPTSVPFPSVSPGVSSAPFPTLPTDRVKKTQAFQKLNDNTMASVPMHNQVSGADLRIYEKFPASLFKNEKPINPTEKQKKSAEAKSKLLSLFTPLEQLSKQLSKDLKAEKTEKANLQDLVLNLNLDHEEVQIKERNNKELRTLRDTYRTRLGELKKAEEEITHLESQVSSYYQEIVQMEHAQAEEIKECISDVKALRVKSENFSNLKQFVQERIERSSALLREKRLNYTMLLLQLEGTDKSVREEIARLSALAKKKEAQCHYCKQLGLYYKNHRASECRNKERFLQREKEMQKTRKKTFSPEDYLLDTYYASLLYPTIFSTALPIFNSSSPFLSKLSPTSNLHRYLNFIKQAHAAGALDLQTEYSYYQRKSFFCPSSRTFSFSKDASSVPFKELLPFEETIPTLSPPFHRKIMSSSTLNESSSIRSYTLNNLAKHGAAFHAEIFLFDNNHEKFESFYFNQLKARQNHQKHRLFVMLLVEEATSYSSMIILPSLTSQAIMNAFSQFLAKMSQEGIEVTKIFTAKDSFLYQYRLPLVLKNIAVYNGFEYSKNCFSLFLNGKILDANNLIKNFYRFHGHLQHFTSKKNADMMGVVKDPQMNVWSDHGFPSSRQIYDDQSFYEGENFYQKAANNTTLLFMKEKPREKNDEDGKESSPSAMFSYKYAPSATCVCHEDNDFSSFKYSEMHTLPAYLDVVDVTIKSSTLRNFNKDTLPFLLPKINRVRDVIEKNRQSNFNRSVLNETSLPFRGSLSDKSASSPYYVPFRRESEWYDGHRYNSWFENLIVMPPAPYSLPSRLYNYLKVKSLSLFKTVPVYFYHFTVYFFGLKYLVDEFNHRPRYFHRLTGSAIDPKWINSRNYFEYIDNFEGLEKPTEQQWSLAQELQRLSPKEKPISNSNHFSKVFAQFDPLAESFELEEPPGEGKDFDDEYELFSLYQLISKDVILRDAHLLPQFGQSLLGQVNLPGSQMPLVTHKRLHLLSNSLFLSSFGSTFSNFDKNFFAFLTYSSPETEDLVKEKYGDSPVLVDFFSFSSNYRRLTQFSVTPDTKEELSEYRSFLDFYHNFLSVVHKSGAVLNSYVLPMLANRYKSLALYLIKRNQKDQKLFDISTAASASAPMTTRATYVPTPGMSKEDKAKAWKEKQYGFPYICLGWNLAIPASYTPMDSTSYDIVSHLATPSPVKLSAFAYTIRFSLTTLSLYEDDDNYKKDFSFLQYHTNKERLQAQVAEAQANSSSNSKCKPELMQPQYYSYSNKEYASLFDGDTPYNITVPNKTSDVQKPLSTASIGLLSPLALPNSPALSELSSTQYRVMKSQIEEIFEQYTEDKDPEQEKAREDALNKLIKKKSVRIKAPAKAKPIKKKEYSKLTHFPNNYLRYMNILPALSELQAEEETKDDEKKGEFPSSIFDPEGLRAKYPHLRFVCHGNKIECNLEECLSCQGKFMRSYYYMNVLERYGDSPYSSVLSKPEIQALLRAADLLKSQHARHLSFSLMPKKEEELSSALPDHWVISPSLFIPMTSLGGYAIPAADVIEEFPELSPEEETKKQQERSIQAEQRNKDRKIDTRDLPVTSSGHTCEHSK